MFCQAGISLGSPLLPFCHSYLHSACLEFGASCSDFVYHYSSVPVKALPFRTGMIHDAVRATVTHLPAMHGATDARSTPSTYTISLFDTTGWYFRYLRCWNEPEYHLPFYRDSPLPLRLPVFHRYHYLPLPPAHFLAPCTGRFTAVRHWTTISVLFSSRST